MLVIFSFEGRCVGKGYRLVGEEGLIFIVREDNKQHNNNTYAELYVSLCAIPH